MIIRVVIGLILAVVVYLVFAALLDIKEEELIAALAALLVFLLCLFAPVDGSFRRGV